MLKETIFAKAKIETDWYQVWRWFDQRFFLQINITTYKISMVYGLIRALVVVRIHKNVVSCENSGIDYAA